MKPLHEPEQQRFHELHDQLAALTFAQRGQELQRLRELAVGGKEWPEVVELLVSHFGQPQEVGILPPGFQCGDCTLCEPLGEGGFGVVYRASQQLQGVSRPVAVKFIRPEYLNPDSVARFEEEVGHLAKLKHPGLIPVYRAGRLDSSGAGQGVPYFVMPLVEGRPLDEAARGRSVQDKLRLLARLCEAIQAAHTHGVLHLDLKPPNILVDSGGQPVVLDFGLARAFYPWAANAPHAAAGTLPYMAPEQLLPAASLDFRTDVYALGVILFQLLTERLPYPEKPGNPDAFMNAILAPDPRRLHDLDSIFTAELREVLGRAIARDAVKRFATAAQFKDAIEQCLARDEERGRPAGPSAAGLVVHQPNAKIGKQVFIQTVRDVHL